MKRLKVCYAKLPNMGDLLNELIFQNLFGVEIEHSRDLHDFDVMGIGSGLRSVFPRRGENLNPVQRAKRAVKDLLEVMTTRHSWVWSTGFLMNPADKSRRCRKNLHFLAVRGEMSKAHVERIIGRKLDIPVGDGGLLADQLIGGARDVRYEIGIIPHFREQDCAEMALLRERHPSAHVIDLTMDPLEVIREIAACAHIFSNSLHGLVVADSLGIPNLRVYLTDAPKGDGFKYDDYYSAFGVKVEPFAVGPDHIPSLNELIDRYKVPASAVESAKKALYASMSGFLKARG